MSTSHAIDALRGLVRAVGELPENAHGTIQGEDLNRAYSHACEVLKEADEFEELLRTLKHSVGSN